jgi:hypothetical protein
MVQASNPYLPILKKRVKPGQYLVYGDGKPSFFTEIAQSGCRVSYLLLGWADALREFMVQVNGGVAGLNRLGSAGLSRQAIWVRVSQGAEAQ